jgi:hypothetical protein
MNSNYLLFLDDDRMPEDCIDWMPSRIGSAPAAIYLVNDWVIVRSYAEFVKQITEHGLPEVISFDHDLADGIGDDEKTGFTCVKWLVEYCIEHNLDFPFYEIHSQNNVGPENMESYIKNFKKHR